MFDKELLKKALDNFIKNEELKKEEKNKFLKEKKYKFILEDLIKNDKLYSSDGYSAWISSKYTEEDFNIFFNIILFYKYYGYEDYLNSCNLKIKDDDYYNLLIKDIRYNDFINDYILNNSPNDFQENALFKYKEYVFVAQTIYGQGTFYIIDKLDNTIIKTIKDNKIINKMILDIEDVIKYEKKKNL